MNVFFSTLLIFIFLFIKKHQELYSWCLNPHSKSKMFTLLFTLYKRCARTSLFYGYLRVQEKRLELSWYCYHTDLNRARLPIPPFLRTNDIVSFFAKYVNHFPRKNLLFSKGTILQPSFLLRLLVLFLLFGFSLLICQR